jgi:hypothetical protein
VKWPADRDRRMQKPGKKKVSDKPEVKGWAAGEDGGGRM